MRYILVRFENDKSDGTCCTFCLTPIRREYVRDLSTGLVYHNGYCMSEHVFSSMSVIEDAARRVP